MNSSQTPNFKPKDIVLNITQVVEDGTRQSVLASKGNDWESVVGLLDNIEHLIGKEISVNSHLNAVMFSEEFNKDYEKTLPIISNYYSDLGANEDLYEAFKRVKNTSLNEQQKHIVKDSIKGF